MKKKLIVSLVITAMMVLLSSCNVRQVVKIPTAVTNTSTARLFTDSVGRKVSFDTEISGIAVTGQLGQIVVFALAPDMLVGIAGEWDNNAEAFIEEKYYQLPVLGQLFGGKGDLNAEELLLASPQVIIDVGEPKMGIVEDLDELQEQLGIPVVHISASIDTFDEAYVMLGELLDKKDEAEVLASYCAEIYKRTRNIAEAVDKVDLLYITGDEGLNVIAKDSYHSEVIDLLSDNLAVLENPVSKGTGNEVDFEQILNWNPDVVIFSPGSIYDTVSENPDWQSITAIQTGNYYEVPVGPYQWMGFPPSVQRYLGMMWMTEMLYPNDIGYSLYNEVKRYFKLFYHSDLSADQYNELIGNAKR